MLALPAVGEHRHEQALAREDALAGAPQRVEHAARRTSTPSPKIVSSWMPLVMYIITPASAMAASPGSSSTSTNCISLPWITKSMSCARRPGAVGGGGTAPARTAGHECRERRHVLDLLPVGHARREHQRVGVDAAVAQVGDDLFLRHRSDLVAANGHVPLLTIRAFHCLLCRRAGRAHGHERHSRGVNVPVRANRGQPVPPAPAHRAVAVLLFRFRLRVDRRGGLGLDRAAVVASSPSWCASCAR